ncbi:MAG TPA: methyl-accepting chemotaxis protein [Nitrospira sp.]|nr:methyl-accepting chemotaxis protein [Nitrospira sp.]
MTTLTVADLRQPGNAPKRIPHGMQRGYVLWIGVLLFLYSALFFTLAFFGPHLQPLVTLYTGSSLADRQEAALKLLSLSETVWVAVPVLFLGAAIFSLVLTKRVAGPLQVLEASVVQWADGDLTTRLKFRQVDRLDALEKSINEGMQAIETSFSTIAREQARAEMATVQIRAALTGQPGSSQKVLQALDEAGDAFATMGEALGKFRFTRR